MLDNCSGKTVAEVELNVPLIKAALRTCLLDCAGGKWRLQYQHIRTTRFEVRVL